MEDIGLKLFQRRQALGMTLEEVGKAVGVGKSTVRKWEKGMIKNMGRDKIAKLANVLQMSPVELVPATPAEAVKNTSEILSSEERFLVDTYRSLSEPGKQYIHQQLTIATHMFGEKAEDADQSHIG